MPNLVSTDMRQSAVKRALRNGGIILSASAVLLLCYELGWGRLAPVSPVLIGFQRTQLGRINVYYHNGTPLPSSLNDATGFLENIETFQQLKVGHPVDIILCGSDNEQERLNGSDVRAKTYPIYGRIVLSHKVLCEDADGTKPLSVFLRHELSHAVLAQNTSAWCLLRTFPRWLDEGMAVYAADQWGKAGYENKAQVAERFRKGLFYAPEWMTGPFTLEPTEAKQFPIPNKAYFFYSEFGLIVEDLVSIFGHDRFREYVRLLIQGKPNDEAFVQVFGEAFSDYLTAFQSRVVEKYGGES